MNKKTIFEQAHTERLLADLGKANTEAAKKERFIQYLTMTFAEDAAAQELISSLTLGAEKTIVDIPRANRLGTGRADTQTDTVIIEWEKDLARTGGHAVEQLTDYLTGNWRSGERYRYVLIATDGQRWRVYAPDWSAVTGDRFSLSDNYALREVRRFDLTSQTISEFPFFLDEVLFYSQPKIATLERIQADFGDTSATFINSIIALRTCVTDVEKNSVLQVALDQWRRFLSIAYGKFDDSPEMFLVHTYLSVFAKFIAYSVISRNLASDDETVKAVLSGSAFESLNIERFVEDDFFHWVNTGVLYKKLRPVFREINQKLAEYDFVDVQEDILKGVYQELIDLDTRHALGEYYTPDWLCERIVNELDIKATSRVLDPACGSGSFLRAVISRLRNEHKDLTADAIASQVVGIDIHPLSVQISKTTVLLALGKRLGKSKVPVRLHVYLANSLLLPQQDANLFESVFTVTVDNATYKIDVSGITGPSEFDVLIDFCANLINRFDDIVTKARFQQLAAGSLPQINNGTTVLDLYKIYVGMKHARDSGRDSIWAFILRNSYKPVFLRNQFDFVIGNPPWLTYADVSSSEYQYLLRTLADKYDVTPQNKANWPHLEIAAIFVAHSINYFLTLTGKLAFVLPRSFMSADQHHNTRAGMVVGTKIEKIWDLVGVSPLFNVPSCVYFGRHDAGFDADRTVSADGLPGYVVAGRLVKSQQHWEDAKPYLKFKKARWHYIQLTSGSKKSRSAMSESSGEMLVGSNAYEKRVYQGATIVPRNFYFIDIPDDMRSVELSSRVLPVRTSQLAKVEAKKPWQEFDETGRMEGQLIFRTALAKNIVPFGLINPPFVALPVLVESDEKDVKRYKVKTDEQLLEDGFVYASRWFMACERYWTEHRTERNADNKVSSFDWLDFQGKIAKQRPGVRYLVVYTASGKNATSTVVDTNELDLHFVADHKTYWYATTNKKEAYYLCGYINSRYANEKIKDFQSRGLFGARDVHKLIVKLPFPKYDPKDPLHMRLSELSERCSQDVKEYLNSKKIDNLDIHKLGRLRHAIMESMEKVLDEIDATVATISTGKIDVSKMSETRRRTGKKPRTGGLFD